MKRDRAIVDSRRKKVLETLVHTPDMRIDELSELFNVSEVTIRRDLQYLEDKNLLIRFYGGARPTEYAKLADKPNEVEMYRELIAKFAATLIEDNDLIFINTSQTALDVIDYIDKKNVTVITNNGHALNKNNSPNLNVLLTGGELRYPKEALVGEFAERNLLSVNAKKAFIGCSGLSHNAGMTTENANEVKLNELMITRVSQEAYILADHTKIGKDSSFTTCSIDQVTNLITDEKAPEEELELLREKGIKVWQVKREDLFE